MKRKSPHNGTSRWILLCFAFFYFFLHLSSPPQGFAQTTPQNPEKAEINGDSIEYDRERSQVIIQGNVEIKYQKTILMCDRAEYDQTKNTAKASGHVRLITEQGELRGDELTFDYNTKTGDFMGAKILAYPYYGSGEKISILENNKMVMTNGYLTTSDYDKPEYRIASKRIEVYPKDKVVAHHVHMKLGEATLMYLPRFWHRIDDAKPKLTFIPGYDSDWGIFLLSQYRFYSSDRIEGTLHLDYRELLDLGEGADLEYKTDNYGTGMLRTYFTKERRIDAERIWDERRTPTTERDRYKIEWRHKWMLNEDTTALAQYYQLSDRTFLKDYFEREFEEDAYPPTFFLLTHSLPQGIASLRSDVRINRFTSAVERKPELRYDLSDTEINDSGFYFKNISSYTNLVKKEPSPSDFRQSTQRGDSDNELSYPLKASIFEVKPFVGARETFYTHTNDPDISNEWREIYRTGTSISTKFYRIYDVDADILGVSISKLRHIITPSVNYLLTSRPTLLPTELNSFDGIDNENQMHNVNFSIENKFQTKRKGIAYDLLRTVFGVDHRLDKDYRKSGFDFITADVDFKPNETLTLYFDSGYDTRNGYLDTANIDAYINGSRWTFGIGDRYSHNADDQITTDFNYTINRKWAFKNYMRIDIETGLLESQDYTLTRDLHSWIMDLRASATRKNGTEFMLMFHLKAFPDMGFDFGKKFEHKRSGSDAIRK